MKEQIKNWSTEELALAMYITKFGIANLGIDEVEAVDVIGNTTMSSLKMQMANFRHILDIEGWKLDPGNQPGKQEVAEEYGNLTITQFRSKVIKFIDQRDSTLRKSKVQRTNRTISKVAKELNERSQENFEAKMKAMSLGGYRKLRKL